MSDVHFSFHRKMIASLMAASMILPMVSGCKKKSQDTKSRYTSGRVIQASDPYFDAEVNPIRIPLDETKKLQALWINNCKYTGDFAIADYLTVYDVPLELRKAVTRTEDGGEQYAYDYNDYQKKSISLFNKSGEYIRDLDKTLEPYCMAQDREGNVHVLVCAGGTGSFGTYMENAEYEYLVLVIDPSGNTIRSTKLEWEEEYRDIGSDLSILDDGMYVYSGGTKMYLFDRNGKMIHEISDGDRDLRGEIVEQDGKKYVMSVKDDPGAANPIQFKELDLQTGKLGQPINADILSGYTNIRPVREGIFVNTLSGFFEYDIRKGTLEEVFNWNDTDVDRTLLNSSYHSDMECIPKNGNEFFVLGYSSKEIYGHEFPYLIHLTRAATNPHAGKKTIVIGGENIFQYQELLSFAGRYSADIGSQSRIVFVDYTEGLRPEDSVISLEQSVYLDSLNGNGADILINMFDSIAFRNEEVMEDLNRYMDGSNGIKREEYFDSVFRACETDGKLYHVPLRYELHGMVTNQDLIPSSGGWTLEEFEKTAQELPDGTGFIEGTLYDDLLKYLLTSALPQFADYPGKKADFDNDDMKRILTMTRDYGVSKIPVEEEIVEADMDFGREGVVSYYMIPVQENFREGKLAARFYDIRAVEDYTIMKDMGPENISFLGYPAREKTGMAVHPTLTMGITSSSTSKDQAWDFIKAFMGRTPSEAVPTPAMSVRRETFETESRAILERSAENYEERFWDSPSVQKYVKIHDMESWSHLVTEDDINEVRNLIGSVTASTCGDPALLDIIMEEAAAYFAGDRSIDEVLKTIQKRAANVVYEK